MLYASHSVFSFLSVQLSTTMAFLRCDSSVLWIGLGLMAQIRSSQLEHYKMHGIACSACTSCGSVLESNHFLTTVEVQTSLDALRLESWSSPQLVNTAYLDMIYTAGFKYVCLDCSFLVPNFSSTHNS